MFKPKTPISGRLENSSGAWIRTKDLRVMSPSSCHCSTPHHLSARDYSTATEKRQAAIKEIKYFLILRNAKLKAVGILLGLRHGRTQP